MKKSYVNGLSDEPLVYATIDSALKQTVEKFGDQDALTVPYQSIRWTWKEFEREVERCACVLLSLGFKPGDRVGIWAPNCWEWVVIQFATARVGIILVNINPAYRLAELECAINTVGCRGFILAESFKSSNYVELMQKLAPEIDTSEPGALKSKNLPTLACVIKLGQARVQGMYNFEELIRTQAVADREKVNAISSNLRPDDAINIQFTSGTTGSPKGATLTHFNILNNGYFVGKAIDLSCKDRLCIPVPLYHCFGMVMGNLACATHGAAMVYPGPSFEPLSVLQAVEQEKCTALYGVPTMFIAQLDHPEFKNFDLASLRTGIMAGSPCPIEVMKRVISEMNMSEVTIAYGMTETSPVSFQSSINDPVDKKVSTVGRIHPHVEVKVINEDGRVVDCGQQGELCTRGYNVMRGYWNDEARTSESIDEAGWMHTGDLATIDGEGYCKITGRVKDVVIRGGENIYPREVEEFFFRLPPVQDAQVFGVPDPKYGEELCVWLALKDGMSTTEEEIRLFCKDQLAHYKVPRYIRFADEFPMTVTGKIQKFKMREAMIAELGLTQTKTT